MTETAVLFPTSQSGSQFTSWAADSGQRNLSIVDPAQQSATTSSDWPPLWMEDLIHHVQQPDSPAVEISVVKRLARAVVQLPRSTPRPEIGVGADGCVALEWDIGSVHFGFQIDPDMEYDAAFFDFDGDEHVTEAPLSTMLGVFAHMFLRLTGVG